MKSILDYLDNTVKNYGEKTAVDDGNICMTWQELQMLSKQIGTELCAKTNSENPIAIVADKSAVTLAVMFGVVYAGCYYVMVDPKQPLDRMQDIFSVLSPKIIITCAENEKLIDETGYGDRKCLLEEIMQDDIDDKRLMAIRKECQEEDILYGIFTSGSTGKPKCIVVSHKSVIDFIGHFSRTFNFTDKDIVGNQAPFDFDVSVKDIYSGLCTGASVAIIPREYFSNPTVLMDYISAQRCTVLIWAVSAMCFVSIMNGLQYKTPVSVRLVMFSGEVMPIKQLNKWTKALPFTTFVNLYGPTEITCNCTYEMLETREYELDEVLPIGKAFDNEKVFLLDANDALIQVPDQEGEICVSGTCVALGYYHDMNKTNEVFVQNPLNDKTYERIYRTGDLGKYTDELKLIYTSRKDFQIKHLGHRIELGEIEAQVEQHADVTRAICIYDSNKKRIFLFYVGNIDGKQLISELRDVLPGYMLPNKAFALDAFPMNKNGKVDRNALKELGGIKHA